MNNREKRFKSEIFNTVTKKSPSPAGWVVKNRHRFQSQPSTPYPKIFYGQLFLVSVPFHSERKSEKSFCSEKFFFRGFERVKEFFCLKRRKN